ncbi:hypothetical protein AAFF_G00171600 [Aldrovandia affinis]|uniref:Uncharacterized protein n=1 Tax=Aldrovandia affinis TaxID=143900 RepID=A0AAD7SYM2_9TELE|nr:hypothetical protein AAFF_G00171600 [Aldrovandia affinis]
MFKILLELEPFLINSLHKEKPVEAPVPVTIEAVILESDRHITRAARRDAAEHRHPGAASVTWHGMNALLSVKAICHEVSKCILAPVTTAGKVRELVSCIRGCPRHAVYCLLNYRIAGDASIMDACRPCCCGNMFKPWLETFKETKPEACKRGARTVSQMK